MENLRDGGAWWATVCGFARVGHDLATKHRSGSVSCGGHCSFPWVLVCTRFCLCPPRVSGVHEKMHWSQQTPSSNNTRDDSTHGHHQMVNAEIRLIIFFAAKDEKLCTVSKKRPGADCGSDYELLIAKLRLKLKKVGKTTRLFRYDLNQIPYDYTVEVRNRFKGLDLINRVSEE